MKDKLFMSANKQLGTCDLTPEGIISHHIHKREHPFLLDCINWRPVAPEPRRDRVRQLLNRLTDDQFITVNVGEIKTLLVAAPATDWDALRERVAKKLHQWISAAQNLSYEDGDVCDDCRNLADELDKLLRGELK